jgi:hypothetical protein
LMERPCFDPAVELRPARPAEQLLILAGSRPNG